MDCSCKPLCSRNTKSSSGRMETHTASPRTPLSRYDYGHEHVWMHQPERVRIVWRAFHQSIGSACDLLSRLQNTAPIACHRRASSCCLLLRGWIMNRDERSVSV